MKMIFDSEGQRDWIFRVLSERHCPTCLFFKSDSTKCNRPNGCVECWKNCGIEVEVKDDSI